MAFCTAGRVDGADAGGDAPAAMLLLRDLTGAVDADTAEDA